MHSAAGKIPKDLFPKIKALVMFGDPSERLGRQFPSELQGKVLQNCADGDPVSGFTPSSRNRPADIFRLATAEVVFTTISLTLGRSGLTRLLTLSSMPSLAQSRVSKSAGNGTCETPVYSSTIPLGVSWKIGRTSGCVRNIVLDSKRHTPLKRIYRQHSSNHSFY